VDHNNVQGTCSSCHNGTKATGKSPNHITTTAECGACHGTLAWTPATFSHTNVAGTCSSCHNGVQATGKSQSHFQTTLQCDTCHRSTTVWTSVRYTHTGARYPGGHTSVSCSQCHSGNSSTPTYSSPAYAPDCAGCHASRYRQSEHKKYTTPTTAYYTVSELRNCAGACHIYTDSSMTTIKTSRTGQHRVSGW